MFLVCCHGSNPLITWRIALTIIACGCKQRETMRDRFLYILLRQRLLLCFTQLHEEGSAYRFVPKCRVKEGTLRPLRHVMWIGFANLNCDALTCIILRSKAIHRLFAGISSLRQTNLFGVRQEQCSRCFSRALHHGPAACQSIAAIAVLFAFLSQACACDPGGRSYWVCLLSFFNCIFGPTPASILVSLTK